LLNAGYYLPANASTGLYSVNTLNNFDGHLILPNALLIDYLSPQLQQVIPDQGNLEDTVVVEVYAENTHFLEAASSMVGWMENESSAILAMTVTPLSNTLTELKFDLSNGFEPGLWTVAVSNDIDGALYLPNAFEVKDTISGRLDHTDLYTLSIVPNPTSDRCFITFHAHVDKPVTMFLVDRNGIKLEEYTLQTSRFSKHPIDLSGLPTGMYFLEIHFHGTSSAYKIIRTP
jgi:hypothetical protein